MFWHETETLASSPDPEVTLEVLNFLISNEVSATEFVSIFFQVQDQYIVYGLQGISLEGCETPWQWLQVCKSRTDLALLSEHFQNRLKAFDLIMYAPLVLNAGGLEWNLEEYSSSVISSHQQVSDQASRIQLAQMNAA